MRGRRLRRAPRAFVQSVAVAVALGIVASGCLAGVGDPYYPTYGNGGYDVDHYDLAVRYDPATDVLQGVATIAAHATTQLSRFDLDLVGLSVHRVTVNGHPAESTRAGHELVVVPASPVGAGRRFTTVVEYSGIPAPTVNGGFIATADGAAVSGEPEGAATWFPVNDHPIDKATYTFRVTVPSGVGVVANGLPRPPVAAGPGWTTHVWEARAPMASYLATIDIGNWAVDDRRSPRGLRIIDAVDTSNPAVAANAAASLAHEGEMIDFLAEQFGPYPFETAGAIVDNFIEPFALETQTRPIYPAFFFLLPDRDLIVLHELAHQWYGDSVSVARWSDIWLNEGFATYAEWLWTEHEGSTSAADSFLDNYALAPVDSPFWNVKIGDPGPDRLFDDAVYVRGAMTLGALRLTIGDDAFFDTLREWARSKRNGNGTTAEFITLAEQISGRQLDALFHAWLFSTTRPPLPPAVVTTLAAPAPTGARASEGSVLQWRDDFIRRRAAGFR